MSGAEAATAPDTPSSNEFREWWNSREDPLET
jgi:hypothetical protein